MHVAPESPRHWWQEPLAFVLAGGMVMGLSLGARHAFGIFMLPVTLEHGWSRETFSFAIALQNLIWGIAQPLVGMVADRHGSRRVVIAGDANDSRTKELIRATHSVYQPNKVVLGNVGSVEEFAQTLPAKDGPLVYLCTGKSCQLPTREPKRVGELLR